MWTVLVIIVLGWAVAKILNAVFKLGLSAGREARPNAAIVPTPPPPVALPAPTLPSPDPLPSMDERAAWLKREADLIYHYSQMKQQRDDALECRDRAIAELDEIAAMQNARLVDALRRYVDTDESEQKKQ